MNKPVNFELAKLLKEKDFDLVVKQAYLFNSEKANVPDGEFSNKGEKYVSAPIIAEVVMWLYEKYGIWISVYSMERSEDWSIYFDYSIKQKLIGLKNISTKLKEFNTPTEAYEAAIEYTLNNLI